MKEILCLLILISCLSCKRVDHGINYRAEIVIYKYQCRLPTLATNIEPCGNGWVKFTLDKERFICLIANDGSGLTSCITKIKNNK